MKNYPKEIYLSPSEFDFIRGGEIERKEEKGEGK